MSNSDAINKAREFAERHKNADGTRDEEAAKAELRRKERERTTHEQTDVAGKRTE
jgi:hypothetical protein